MPGSMHVIKVNLGGDTVMGCDLVGRHCPLSHITYPVCASGLVHVHDLPRLSLRRELSILDACACGGHTASSFEVSPADYRWVYSRSVTNVGHLLRQRIPYQLARSFL